MNSYDPEVYSAYVPGCHPTDEGYRILGEHIAKEVIRISLENEADGQFLGRWNGFTVSCNEYGGVPENGVSGNSISGNTLGDVSGNSVSGNAPGDVSANDVSGNDFDGVWKNSVSGNAPGDISANSVSGNAAGDVSGNSVSGNTSGGLSDNDISVCGELLESGTDILENSMENGTLDKNF